MTVESGYTFDLSGTLVSAPEHWHIPTLPYRADQDRWMGHVEWCGQCAQHVHEVANHPGVLTPPCAVGAPMLYDLASAKTQQRIESLRN